MSRKYEKSTISLLDEAQKLVTHGVIKFDRTCDSYYIDYNMIS
jgi:hypothetical protein